MRWCNKVRFSCFPDGKAIKALVCCGCAASAEDSEQALHSECVHWELSLPMGFFALGFSSQYCVWWGKKGGEMQCWFLSFQFSWKERTKHLLWILLAIKATHLLAFFFLFSILPALQSFKKCEVQSLCEDQELQNWRKTDMNVLAHTVSRTHARTHTPTSKPVRAHTRTPPDRKSVV